MTHRPIIFVAMPNDKLFENWWTDLIQPVANELSARATRVRFLPKTESALSLIFESIETCHVCIALAIDRNPNVYLEVGYALACNKKTIIIANDNRVGSFFSKFAAVIQSHQPDSLTSSRLAHQIRIAIEATITNQSRLIAE
jgi:hypothetical protein